MDTRALMSQRGTGKYTKQKAKCGCSPVLLAVHARRCSEAVCLARRKNAGAPPFCSDTTTGIAIPSLLFVRPCATQDYELSGTATPDPRLRRDGLGRTPHQVSVRYPRLRPVATLPAVVLTGCSTNGPDHAPLHACPSRSTSKLHPLPGPAALPTAT